MTLEPQNLRRRWLAIALASLVMAISYWMVVFAAVAGRTEDGPASTPPFALGMALVPFAFLALAYLTGQRDAPWAVLKAMGLFVVIGLPIGLFEVIVGLVAGYGAGAVVSVRSVEGVHRRRDRAIAVLLAVAYTFVVLQILPAFGVLTGSVIPFVAVGIADQVTEGRLADHLAREASAGMAPTADEGDAGDDRDSADEGDDDG